VREAAASRGRLAGLGCGFAVVGCVAGCAAAESADYAKFLSSHPIFLVLVMAVAAPLLAEIITEIGTQAASMRADTAAALIGAAMLSVLVFPTLGNVLLSRSVRSSPDPIPSEEQRSRKPMTEGP
jgi:hypothetical protein